MKKTLCALTLAGLLGSCSSGPSAEEVAICKENLEESEDFAKAYKIERAQKRLESIDCSANNYSALWATNVIMKDELNEHCWNLIKEDPFNKLILTRQGFCLGYIGKLKMDIRELQTLINDYKGEKQ